MANQFSSIVAIIAIRMKTEFDLDPEDPTYSSARKSILSCIVPLLGIIVACLPTLEPAIQRIFGMSASPSPVHTSICDPTFAKYWKTTVLSGRGLEEPEMPLVTLTQPFMTKMGYLAPGIFRSLLIGRFIRRGVRQDLIDHPCGRPEGFYIVKFVACFD